MASNELREYVSILHANLAALGIEVGPLTSAAEGLVTLLDTDPATITEEAWRRAVSEWERARSQVMDALGRVTLGALTDLPLIRDLAGDAESLANTGVNANIEVGPVRVVVRTAVLYLDPPKIPGVELPPVPIGPFRLGAVEASLTPPGSGVGPSIPGGGSLVRLGANIPEDGWGGMLSVPVPPVLATASAIFAVDDDTPNFLAVLGLQFLPPIQLSFGFALDRVGGIVAVNRGMDLDALRAAVRTGAAGDALLQARPPKDPRMVAETLDRLFPRQVGSHIFGPSMRLTWLSSGAAGSLASLDLAIVVQLPDGRIAIIGVARLGIPGLPRLLNLRLDLLGLIDVVDKLVTIDASLVDSHVLGVFQIYGDAALRLSWGSQPYVVVSVGGFFPGFDPKPAKLPALRRVGMSQSVPGVGIELRVEGYFAVTANTVQLGGRMEACIDVDVLTARGFLETDAIMQFRPFRFEARVAAGFSVSAGGFDFASVQLSGQISGPGPVVVQGSLSISVFLFEVSWDQSFTLGEGPADALPASRPLLDVLHEELNRHENLRAGETTDPLVVLTPRPPVPGKALVPPTGTLIAQQRLAPLGLPISRLKGVPLPGIQGARIKGMGADVRETFAPGVFLTLTDAELVNRPPFESLPAGKVLTPQDSPLDDFPNTPEERTLCQIVIDTRTGKATDPIKVSTLLDLQFASSMVAAAQAEPALSNASPILSAGADKWSILGSGGPVHDTASTAHEWARITGGIAIPQTDLADPVGLTGVL